MDGRLLSNQFFIAGRSISITICSIVLLSCVFCCKIYSSSLFNFDITVLVILESKSAGVSTTEVLPSRPLLSVGSPIHLTSSGCVIISSVVSSVLIAGPLSSTIILRIPASI